MDALEARRFRYALYKDSIPRHWRTWNPFKKRYLNTSYSITVVLDPDSDDASMIKVQEKIIAMGYVVLEKSSNRLADTFIVKASEPERAVEEINKVPGVRVAIPSPRYREMGATTAIHGVNAFFPVSGETCSSLQTLNNSTKIDTIRGPPSAVENIGAGTLVIVWDFIPEDSAVLQVPELDWPDGVQLPGGGTAPLPPKLTVFRNNSNAISSHGGKVASACCGVNAGLARGAQVILLGISNDIRADLAIIDSICSQSFSGPVIVNMSFGIEFSVGANPFLRDRTLTFIEDVNLDMMDMKARHPRLMFFAAAGNESISMCSLTGPTDIPRDDQTVCSGCIVWPQFELNNFARPFLTVGSSQILSSGGNASRRFSSFSNHGPCIDIVVHGATTCLWDADSGSYRGTQGTSFSSPLAASLAALIFSNGNNQPTAAQVESLLAASTVPAGYTTGLPPGTTDRLTVLQQQFYTSPFGDSVVPQPLPSSPPSGSLPSPDQDDLVLLVLVVVVVIIIIFMAKVIFGR